MQKRWFVLPLVMLMTACTQTGQYPICLLYTSDAADE